MGTHGFVLKELVNGVDDETAKRLKYTVPDMREHNVKVHLSFNALEMVARNLNWAPDYGRLSKEEQAQCNVFVAAHISECEKRCYRTCIG